jgi:nucleotide-binding universal stress UspA family protein
MIVQWMNGPPRTILLATDLSARSDRALDRAALLAKHWQAQLTVLHVLENREPPSHLMDLLPSWRRPSDPLSIARKNIFAELNERAEKATILIEEGDPVESIVRVANKDNSELIVIGVARNELLGQFNLGRTVDRLLRRSQAPLLVVKERARRPYRHIVVATDFSESSRHALVAATQFFPEETLTVFNAYDSPMSGLITDVATYRRECRKVATQDCEAFLRDTEMPKKQWRRPNVLIEYGAPSHLLHDYVIDNAVDLVVLGTHVRSALFDVLIGSVAKHILDDVPCDTLMIREPLTHIKLLIPPAS